MSEIKTNKVKWLHLRLSEDEHKKIHALFKRTTCRKLSQYARNVLLNRPVTVNQRNQSLDEFMAEMIRLRTELNAVGNNLNQAVKKLHTLTGYQEFRDWHLNSELHRQTVLDKVEQIKARINEIADKWLQ